MAVRTPLGLTLPEEQAEPAEIITPARSRAITCREEAQPRAATHRVLGKRGAPSPTTTAPAAFSRAAAASRQAAWTAGLSRSRRAAAAAAAKPAIPETF